MPQKTYSSFAVGRVRALENKLLTAERVQRMLEAADFDEAMRLLVEIGYGQGSEQPDDYESLIAAELRRCAALIAEISPEPTLTNLFFWQYDLHNIKTLYKARYSDESVATVLSPLGTIPIEKVQAALEEKNYRDLPEAFRAVLVLADRNMREQIDPGIFDAWCDKAYYQAIAQFLRAGEYDDPFITDYFALSADFNNILLVLRLKAMGRESSLLTDLFLSGGTLPLSTMQALFERDDAPLKANSRFSRQLDQAMQNLRSGGSTATLERDRDNALYRLAADLDQGPLAIGPIFRYLLAREQEAKVVRLILTGKANRLPDRLLRERVRDLNA